MGRVAKYNIFKGVSTVLTLGTPIATLCCCGDFFIHRSETAISVTGIFCILIALLLFKDKIVENWKMPSAFVLCIIVLIAILLIEHIIIPIKYVCIATLLSTGIDELTFKRYYKNIEVCLPTEAQTFKHIGFLFVTSDKLDEIVKNGDSK